MPWNWKARSKHSVEHGGNVGTVSEALTPGTWPSYEAAYLANRLGSRNPTSAYDNKYLGKAGESVFTGMSEEQKLVYLQNVTENYKEEAEETLRDEFKQWLQGTHEDNSQQSVYPNRPGQAKRRFLYDESEVKHFDGRRGRGYPGAEMYNWRPTWWGQAQLTHLPGVREYLRSGEQRSEENSFALNMLAEHGPQNLEQAWAYFKHWVKGRPLTDAMPLHKKYELDDNVRRAPLMDIPPEWHENDGDGSETVQSVFGGFDTAEEDEEDESKPTVEEQNQFSHALESIKQMLSISDEYGNLFDNTTQANYNVQILRHQELFSSAQSKAGRKEVLDDMKKTFAALKQLYDADKDLNSPLPSTLPITEEGLSTLQEALEELPNTGNFLGDGVRRLIENTTSAAFYVPRALAGALTPASTTAVLTKEQTSAAIEATNVWVHYLIQSKEFHKITDSLKEITSNVYAVFADIASGIRKPTSQQLIENVDSSDASESTSESSFESFFKGSSSDEALAYVEDEKVLNDIREAFMIARQSLPLKFPKHFTTPQAQKAINKYFEANPTQTEVYAKWRGGSWGNTGYRGPGIVYQKRGGKKQMLHINALTLQSVQQYLNRLAS